MAELARRSHNPINSIATDRMLPAMTFRVLFVTSEFEDYVARRWPGLGVGGVAARDEIAGGRQASASRLSRVLSKVQSLEMVGRCPALGEMPACSIGRTATPDGLPVYVVICPELYDRDGYALCATRPAATGATTTCVSPGLSSAAAFLAAGQVDPDWCADILHANDWPSAMAPAYLAWNELRVPTILTIHNLAYQGLFPRETLRPDRRAGCCVHHRRARILQQGVVPQERARLCRSPHHRQRDLCAGDHDAAIRLPPRRGAAQARAEPTN